MITLKMIMMSIMMFMMKTISPLKMGMSLVVLSSIIFISMKEMMGSTWFPLIFLLMFVGGIIVVFMILSALSPNQKSSKVKKYLMYLLILIIFPTSYFLFPIESLTMNLKWAFNSGYMMMMSMTMIMFYFFCFLFLLGKEKFPLR